MLSRIFEKAPSECEIDIVFVPDDPKDPANDCRDDLLAYLAKPTVVSGRRVSQRLQKVTTHRSGLGLLFLMSGSEIGRTRLVVARFPADQGIIAEEKRSKLSVAFIERVFMKNAHAYKAVMYEDTSFNRGFWDGKAADRQISGPKELSDYWIRDFLKSELKTTAAAGTKRLAVALRHATRETQSVQVRQELVAAATLLRGQDGKTTTGRQLIDHLGLSEPATETLARTLPREDLLDETFQFDAAEFDRHLLYRLVELDNGGMLIAEDKKFDDIFEVEEVSGPQRAVNDLPVVRYSTEGTVIDERLRGSR
jgi:hypothetical protein